MKYSHYTLNKGPSKFDLMKALFDQKGNSGKPYYVTFGSDVGQDLVAHVKSVCVDHNFHNSGESWVIEGVIVSTQKQRTGRRAIKVSHKFEFTAHFHTNRRIGWLKPKEEIQVADDIQGHILAHGHP